MNTTAISGADVRSPKRRVAFKQTTYQQPMVAFQTVPYTVPNAAPVVIPQTNVVPVVPAPSVASKPKDMSKTVAIASSALAIASAGIATYAILRSRKAGAFKGQIEELSRQVAENRQASQTQLTDLKNSILDGLRVNEQRINIVEQSANGAKAAAESAQNPVVINNTTVITEPIGILTKTVNINGTDRTLSSVMHGYGEAEETLTNELRSESTKRILGVRKILGIPESPSIHAFTSELSGLVKAGGLAIVPRELIANLISHVKGAKGYVHMPLYTEQIENNASLSLEKGKNGTYKYVKTITDANDPSKEKKVTIATLRKSHDMKLDIHTDKGISTEDVGVFISDYMYQAVPLEETLSHLEETDHAYAKIIKTALKQGKNFETDAMKFTAPKKERTAVQYADKSTADINIDRVLEILNPERAEEIKAQLKIGKQVEIQASELTESGKDLTKVFSEDVQAQLDADIAKHHRDGSVPAPVIKFMPEVPAKAEAKFKMVLYDNRKFKMAGPKIPGLDKNMYNNHSHQSGETERFVYFCKYAYENIVNNEKYSEEPMDFDWIIGNDWHTGPLAAMLRLLTPAKAAFGEITPAKAEKIKNIPMTVIMHNFKLNGSVYHSQEKLLNIMFGEHAAKIAENAWMPQNANLPFESWNGLFHGDAFNPQGQAMAYADNVAFVSKGNAKEATEIKEKGGINYKLASMRARTGDFEDRSTLEKIGSAFGIKAQEIPEYPTAKGITNGCDRVNNILTKTKARKMEEDLGLKVGALKSEEEARKNPFAVHQHNKGVILKDRVIPDLNMAKETNGEKNPLKILDFEHTDLTGVNENTPIIGQAGRIVDQKGIDIYVAGYEELIRSGNYDKSNVPVLWLNGKGDQQFFDKFLEAKARIRKIDPVAADRMVCSGVFGEPSRYDSVKLMIDFSAMSSWDEPCGLVHKEIAYFSGAIPIVNKVGGLTDGLFGYKVGGENSKANAIFVDFMDKDTHPYDEALKHNAEEWSKAMSTALGWYKDTSAFGKGIKNSFIARHDWPKGKTQEYVELGKRLGVFSPSVDSDYARFATSQAA